MQTPIVVPIWFLLTLCGLTGLIAGLTVCYCFRSRLKAGRVFTNYY